MTNKILFEYLHNNLDLNQYTVIRRFDDSKQQRKIALEVPFEITVDNSDGLGRTMSVRTPANIDVECELEQLMGVLGNLNANIVPYCFDDIQHYINFSFDGLETPIYDEQGNNIYQINYSFSAIKK